MTKTHVTFAILLALIIMGAVFFLRPNNTPQTVQETSTPQVQNSANAKINIDAVCEGALAYMSFENGAAADLFVSECKEGKHPEVIDQYKAQLNLGSDVAI